jgi:putative methionine-R-sulfoxide reductase with GAF domain
MVHLPMSDPDHEKPGSSSVTGPDKPPEAESDLVGLAARVSALSGSGLSNELSTDLALEIVLNQIVEQACLATGATDAAIVLERNGELVCRASTGANAPELGVRLDTEAGLSGACVKTRQMQRCDDAQSDPRADVEGFRRLDIRSVMILPLLRNNNNDLVGVFELFSPRPSAFGERDERTLEALGQRALKNLQLASDPHLREVPDASSPLMRPEQSDVAELETRRSESASVPAELVSPNDVPQFDVMTFGLRVAVLACAVLLCTLVGFRWGWHRGTAGYTHKSESAHRISSKTQQQNLASSNTGASSLLTAAMGNSASTDSLPAVGPFAISGQKVGACDSPSRPRPAVSTAPVGSLLVYENGKEVFRKLPSAPGEKKNANGTK